MEDLFLLEDEEKPYNIRHRALLFSKELVLFIKNASYDRKYFSMFDQLLRSGTSIGANLVEGRSGSSKKDWKNFYAIALKSANETKYWICLIRDTLEFEKEKLNKLLKEADELSKIIASIIVSD
jgi:four helix bundle protein